jgi:hypothetical protein
MTNGQKELIVERVKAETGAHQVRIVQGGNVYAYGPVGSDGKRVRHDMGHGMHILHRIFFAPGDFAPRA